MRRIEELVQPLRDSGEIVSTFANAGQNGATNSGFMVMALAPWDQRERSQQQIVADIDRAGEAGAGRAHLPGHAQQPRHTRRRQRPAIRDRRQQLRRCSATPPASSWRNCEKDPRFQQPRLSTDADAAAARRRHRPRTRLRPRHQHHRPGRYACRPCSTAARSATSSSRTAAIAVKLISTTNPVNDPTDLENIFAQDRRWPLRAGIDHRHADGAPRAALAAARAATARRSPSPPALRPDFALGDALEAAEEVAAPLLPAGNRIIPLAEAATLDETSAAC